MHESSHTNHIAPFALRQPPAETLATRGLNLIGTYSDDVMVAGTQGVTMQGLDGDDQLRGSPEDDLLLGGYGDDFLLGQGGNDTLLGGEGDDLLHGNQGQDRLHGGSGDDLLFGHTGNDVLDGGSGDDVLDGGPGQDFLHGGTGDDILSGGSGADVLIWRRHDLCGDDHINGFEPGQDQVWLPTSYQPGGEHHANVQLETSPDQSILRISNTERHCHLNIRFENTDLSDGGSLSAQQALSRLLVEGSQLV